MEAHARSEEGAEALSRGTAEIDPNCIGWESVLAVGLGDAAAEHGPHSAVGVPDGECDVHWHPALEGWFCQFDQFVVQRPFKPMVLILGTVKCLARRVGLLEMEHSRKVNTFRLPVLDGLAGVKGVGPPHHLGDSAKAQVRHDLPHFVGNEHEVIDQVFRPARKSGTQLGILRCNSNGAGVQVAFAEHYATTHHQCRGGKTEFLGSQ